MNEIVVRPAEAGDVAGMAASSAALFAEDAGSRDSLRNQGWPASHGEQWCRDLLGDPDALAMVAVLDGDVVGHLVGAYSPASPMWTAPRAELVSMFVLSSLRGAGVGARLVHSFMTWADKLGAVRLHVSAYEANEGAIRFYGRCGFAIMSVDLVAVRVRTP